MMLFQKQKQKQNESAIKQTDHYKKVLRLWSDKRYQLGLLIGAEYFMPTPDELALILEEPAVKSRLTSSVFTTIAEYDHTLKQGCPYKSVLLAASAVDQLPNCRKLIEINYNGHELYMLNQCRPERSRELNC